MSCDDQESTESSDQKITITIGETRTLTFTVKQNGVAIDITGWKGYLTARRSYTDLAPAIEKKTSNAGGSDTQALVLDQVTRKGQIQFYIVRDDTYRRLDPAKGPLRWDAWAESPGGTTVKLAGNSTMILEPNITRF